MAEDHKLQETFLAALCKDKLPVNVFLVNGIKLQGYIETYDDTTLVLQNTIRQMVFKHAISTIVPSKNVNIDG